MAQLLAPDSVLSDLDESVDHTGDVAKKLQEECPQNLKRGSLFDQNSDKGEEKAKNDEKYFHRPTLPVSLAGSGDRS